MSSCGIYKITNKINNKSYIGQSIYIEQRWRHHKNYNFIHSHYPLYRAFVKYGIDNFDFEIIEICDRELLDEKEIFYIKYYDSYLNGYNQTTGGSGNGNNFIKLSIEDIYEIYDLLSVSSMTQHEIALKFNVGDDTISEINHGKTRRDSSIKYPIRNNKAEKNFCPICGKEISTGAKKCLPCKNMLSRRVERPNRDELKFLIRNYTFTELSKKFKVSDKAISKWCILENLPSTKKEIKKYSDIDWEKI